MAIIFDTGPLFALLDPDDPAHARCVALLQRTREDLVVPAPVLVEVDYWVHQRIYPEAFIPVLDDILSGIFRIVEPNRDDYMRIRELCRQYADSDIGFVDAAVFAIVERLNEPKLATLDHRHFAMMRPRHVPAITLLP